MLSLGVESTAHSFSIGIITEEGEVLANEIDMYRPEKGWGIKPTEAAEHHKEVEEEVLEKALKKADVDMGDMDIIAFSQGPGLPPCLSVGLRFAKKLATEHRKPLFGPAHTVAHIEIGKLMTEAEDPITLYVSGGNTQVIALAGGKYRVFGETQDVGIGNALDKFGREAGMQFPAGPRIEKLARKGKYIQVPYTVKGMDLSFSGLLSDCIRRLKDGQKLEDLCFSLQETAFAMLTEVTERAMAHTDKKELLLTGGVGVNQRLQEMLKTMCRERGAEFYNCPGEYAGDNGVMIAWTGILMKKGRKKPLNLKKADVKPRWRTDNVEILWR